MAVHSSKSVTLTDVAEAAGVSRWLAGRVLNGGKSSARSSEETRQRIIHVAKQLHYHPNHAARMLTGKRSHSFGLLVLSSGDPLRSFLVEYLDARSMEVGCHTLIGNTMGPPDVGPNQFDQYVDIFAQRGVDGVFCTVHHWCEGDRERLLERHPNTVFYENPGLPGAAYVEVDREEAVRLAVRHLSERGCQKIGLAVMTLSRQTHIARRRGYEIEMALRGLPFDECSIFNGEKHGLVIAKYNTSSNKWDFPIEVMDQVINSLVRDQGCDAIVAHDDFWAAAMIKRMRARGISVPHDVAVVGYLNHYLADWSDPALTTVHLRHNVAAEMMVQMLERMVTEGPLPEDERVVKIKPKLIVRESA
ncbi:MAG: LacI family DNA-binding transcriptional regulator [Pirellulales bacterium]|nr:LacI family DNA-binding transcriptional regulator [Pirellulales bacterium]